MIAKQMKRTNFRLGCRNDYLEAALRSKSIEETSKNLKGLDKTTWIKELAEAKHKGVGMKQTNFVYGNSKPSFESSSHVPERPKTSSEVNMNFS